MARVGVRAALLGFAVLVGATITVHGADAPASTPAFAKIPINLVSGVLDAVLPFDVPFVFTGTAPDGTERVSAWFVEITDRVKAAQRANLRTRTAGAPPTNEFRCPELTATSWIPLNALQGEGAAFTVQVPRLDANRYYCFRFDTEKALTGPELDKFRVEAADKIDLALQAVPGGSLSDTAAENLRLQLRELLLSLRAPGAVVIKRGSLFDNFVPTDVASTAALNTIKKAFNDRLLTLRDDQLHRGRAIVDYKNLGDNAKASMNLWNKADDASRLYLQLSNKLSTTPQSAAAIMAGTRLAAMQRLATESSREQSNEILGNPVGSIDQIIDDAPPWTPTSLDARIRIISKLADDLEGQSNLVVQLSPAAFTTALGAPFTTASLTALSNQIRATAAIVRTELGALTDAKDALTVRRAKIEAIAADLALIARTSAVLVATSVGDFSTRHSWYLSADLGLATAPTIEEVFPYAGMNVYFRPVNKSAPLQDFGPFFSKASLVRRASALVGVTVAANLEKSGERQELFAGGRMLVLGGGLRITDSIRANGGLLLFKAPDPNPLIDKAKLHVTPFFSFSVDWDVKGTFTNLAGNAPTTAAPAAPASGGAAPSTGTKP